MANTLKIKRSSVPNKVPLVTDLDLGELAVNTYDGKLYTKKNVAGVETIVDLTSAENVVANVFVSNTAPSSPTEGTLWWDSESGNLKIYYIDTDSSQWVDAVSPAIGEISGGGTEDTNTTYEISAETTTGGAQLRLTGSDNFVDNVKFASGTNVTVTRTDASTITINSTDTNTITRLRGTSAGTYNSGDITLLAGGAITVSQAGNDITVAHTDTSNAANLTASGRTYVTGLTFDTYGHVTGYSTGTETVTDTNTITRLRGTASGTYTSGDLTLLAGNAITITQSGSDITVAHTDTSSQASVDNSAGNVIQDITLDTNGHITSIGSVNLDDRYYTESESDARFINATGDSMTGFLTLHADPTSALHAATKEYVDNVSAGLKAAPAVEAATTANLTATYNNGALGVGATLTATSNGAFPAIDGVTISTTAIGLNGVLIKNQTNAAHNGRYNLTQVGSGSTPWILTRCAVCDQANEIPGSYVFVKGGTTQANTGWTAFVSNPSTFVVGTDNISYFQFSGAGTYTAGNGLTLTGTQFSHTDTSNATNLTASGRTYVTGLTFDTFGHVTGYTTGTETFVDTNTTYSAGNGISLSGTTFSVAAGAGLIQEASGLAHADTSSAANLTASGRTYVTGLVFDTYGHVTGYNTGTETVVNTNTTYGISAETTTDGANIRLTGSDSSTDNLKLAAGTNISITRTDADTITISASGGGGGGASVSISTTPPTSPNPGDLWWNSESGQMYVRYDDGDSSQWVAIAVGAAGAKGDKGDKGDPGITVSATAPSSPSVNDLWLDIS
jgi:hypothetical protein